jgi:hypothetical protein
MYVSTAMPTDLIDAANTITVNAIIREAVAQAPGAEVQDRRIRKVRAEDVRPGDIELTSRRHLDQNLVIDSCEPYSDVSVLIFYVGHPSPREVMHDRILTVAR